MRPQLAARRLTTRWRWRCARVGPARTAVALACIRERQRIGLEKTGLFLVRALVVVSYAYYRYRTSFHHLPIALTEIELIPIFHAVECDREMAFDSFLSPALLPVFIL